MNDRQAYARYMSSDDVQLVLEHFDNKFDSLAEALQVMGYTMQTLAKDSDLQEVKLDVEVIKLAVTDTNKDLRKLERRVTKLEAVA
ncbi:MAG: hypothetical protein AAB971_02930 [Patescibacteria group bacterium]